MNNLLNSPVGVLHVPWDYTCWRCPSAGVASSDRGDEQRSLHVALVSNSITVREAKLAYAARLGGLNVTRISNREAPPDLRQHFNSCFTARNAWHALRLLKKIGPDVVHFVSGWHFDPYWLYTIFANTGLPKVFDQYDCLHGMFRPNHLPAPELLRIERYCFENADHVCSRSLEPLALRRQFDIKLPPTTYFPDYCWNPPLQRNVRAIRDGDELHVVYAGGIWPEDRYPSQRMGYAQYLDIGRSLAKQSVHLHLYPSPTFARIAPFEKFFSLYLQESRANRFFHIHRPLEYESLMEELPSYDAALHIFGVGVTSQLGRNTIDKLRLGSANKLFDYLEAGLPVIIHDGLHQRAIVNHYGLAVRVDCVTNMRRAIVSAFQQANGAVSSSTVHLAFHATRLRQMYYKVVAGVLHQ